MRRTIRRENGAEQKANVEQLEHTQRLNQALVYADIREFPIKGKEKREKRKEKRAHRKKENSSCSPASSTSAHRYT